MNHSKNNFLLGTLALLVAGILGGLAPLGAKIILRELPPLTSLFLRISVMIAVLLPLMYRSIPHMLVHWKRLILLGLLWAGNVALFIIGIKETTSLASQLLYAGVPIMVLLEQYFVEKKRISVVQIFGILLGVIGIILLFIKPSGNSLGTIHGNLIIFIGTISWSAYIVASKRMSGHMTPAVLTTGSALVAWVAVGICLLLFDGIQPLLGLSSLSLSGWHAILFLGFGLGVIMMLLYQWGIKHGSVVIASCNIYVSSLVTTFVGVTILGEVLSQQLVFGGILLLVGVYFTSIQPLFSVKS